MSAYAISFPSLLPPLATTANYFALNGKSEEKAIHENVDDKKGNEIGEEDEHDNIDNCNDEDISLNTALHISVKSADLDPVALVGKYISNRPIPRRIKQWRNRHTSRVNPSPNSPPYPGDIASSSDFDAVQFQLSITLNGRKYTAIRTLSRFAQLRNELVRELREDRSVKKMTHFSSRRKACENQNLLSIPMKDNVEQIIAEEDCSSLLPELPSISNNREPTSVRNTTTTGFLPASLTGISSSGLLMAKAAAVSVLPIGFASRSFTVLKNSLVSYCPLMEHWLKGIIKVVNPDFSPSLSKFLWEPLSEDNAGVPNLVACGGDKDSLRCNNNTTKRRSFQTLSSIVEVDFE